MSLVVPLINLEDATEDVNEHLANRDSIAHRLTFLLLCPSAQSLIPKIPNNFSEEYLMLLIDNAAGQKKVDSRGLINYAN